MRFMMIVKASKDYEAGKMPSASLLAAMNRYNEELMKAGVLLDLAGLHPTSKGFKVRYTGGGQPTVIDGPFTESKELVGGYWIIQVRSREEALEWARRAPAPHEGQDCEIEVRQIFELSEFEPNEAVVQARELGKQLQNSVK